MTEMQYAEEALKAQAEFFKILTAIKWILLSMSIAIWALVLKQVPVWWNSFNKKKPFTLEQMKKDLAAAERPRVNRKTSIWDK